MRSILLASLLVIAGFTTMVQADGLIYQLPKDGAQVRYETETTLVVDGQEQTLKGSLTVSSVGHMQENGEECRWIEIKMITPQNGQDQIVVSKVLVPEKHLGTGKSAAENAIRVWVKEGDAQPQSFRDLKESQAVPQRIFLAGPPKNPGELDKKEVDGKLGKLDCAGVTGELEFEVEFGTIGISLENRLHEKAPFGLVSALWKFELKNNGQVALQGTFKLTVADTSTTALSELPDRK
jgi:hypothetical protein